MDKEQRGLRFAFNAGAEVTPEGSPKKISTRVLELSLRGCFLEMPSSLREQQHVQVKIWHADEYFEASAQVLYVKATGVGLVFGSMKPHSRNVLQAWILAALDSQVKLQHS